MNRNVQKGRHLAARRREHPGGKRLSLLLALSLCLSCLAPVWTLAAEDTTETVYAYSDGGSVTVEVGNVTVNDVLGVSVCAEGGSVDVTTGDIAVAGNEWETVGAYITVKDGEALLKVKGDITVEAEDGADGVWAYGIDTESWYEIDKTTVEVDGDIAVTGMGSTGIRIVNSLGDTTVAVNGDVTAEADGYATGVEAYGYAGENTVTVDGDVTAAGSIADGIYAGGSGDTTVNVTGDITAEAGIHAYGIDIFANGGETTVTVDGDITATARATSEVNDAAGIYIISDRGETKVTVNGNIMATGGDFASGIMIGNSGSVVTAVVIGDVTTDGDSYSFGLDLVTESNAETTVEVSGNVTGDTGILVSGTGAATDVLVAGTISGGERSVRLTEEVTMDNVTLTAWKIELNENGNAAERSTWDKKTEKYIYDTAEDFEKSILYIIKIEQPAEGATLSATDAEGKALATSHDYDVATEGETVLLKVDVQEGYTLLGAYNGADGAKVELLQDKDGTYYVIVPKGGGVYLTAELEKAAQGEPAKEDTAKEGTIKENAAKEDTAKETAKPQTGYSAAGSYTVTIDLDGGTLDGETGKLLRTYAYGETITLPDAPTRNGYTFQYWEINAHRYLPGDSYTVRGAVTIKAIWEKD